MSALTVDSIVTELRRRAFAELARKDKAAYKAEVRESVLAGLHARQLDVVVDVDMGRRFLALCTSRRAGKTVTLAALIVLKLLEAGHNQSVIFIAATLWKGRDLIWAELTRIIKDHYLDWKLSDHHGTISTPEGGKFSILGLSTQGKAEAPRGADVIAAFVDEVQDSEHLLMPLLTAIEPALAGSNGVLVLAGTPGYQPVGTWHSIAELGAGGFVRHHFTMLDNPHLTKPAEEILAEVLERKGWTEQEPEFQREYRGVWVPDDSTMIFSFHPEKNSLLQLPDDYSSSWTHVMALDLGFDDHSAWCVLALDPQTQRKVVIHAESHRKLFSDQQVEITKRLIQAHGLTRVVCDPAAGGLGFYNAFNAQHGRELGVTIRGANKVNKAGRVAQVNSELRSGRLTLLRPGADALAREIQVLRYRNREACEFLTSTMIRDDIADCLMYALVELMPLTAPREVHAEPVASRLERLFDQQANPRRTVRDQIVG